MIQQEIDYIDSCEVVSILDSRRADINEAPATTAHVRPTYRRRMTAISTTQSGASVSSGAHSKTVGADGAIILRSSSAAGENGSPDTWRDPRGFRGVVLHLRGQLRPARQQHPGVIYPRRYQVPGLHPPPEAPARHASGRGGHEVGLLDSLPEIITRRNGATHLQPCAAFTCDVVHVSIQGWRSWQRQHGTRPKTWPGCQRKEDHARNTNRHCRRLAEA
jgi:hypothetical protein